MALIVRPIAIDDRAAWEPLWAGYLTFYETSVPAATTDLTWSRFLDPAEPMHALGAFAGSTLVGIVHFLYHRTTWHRPIPATSRTSSPCPKRAGRAPDAP